MQLAPELYPQPSEPIPPEETVISDSYGVATKVYASYVEERVLDRAVLTALLRRGAA